MSSISVNLSRISSTAEELNRASDEATALLRSLDQTFAKLNLGEEFFDRKTCGEGREKFNGEMHAAIYNIGYARDDDGKFGIVVRAGARCQDDDGETYYAACWIRRADQVARGIRLAALSYLPEFIAAYAEHLEAAATMAKRELARSKAAANELKSALIGNLPHAEATSTLKPLKPLYRSPLDDGQDLVGGPADIIGGPVPLIGGPVPMAGEPTLVRGTSPKPIR